MLRRLSHYFSRPEEFHYHRGKCGFEYGVSFALSMIRVIAPYCRARSAEKQRKTKRREAAQPLVRTSAVQVDTSSSFPWLLGIEHLKNQLQTSKAWSGGHQKKQDVDPSRRVRKSFGTSGSCYDSWPGRVNDCANLEIELPWLQQRNIHKDNRFLIIRYCTRRWVHWVQLPKE